MQNAAMSSVVIAGLVPAIHLASAGDHRDKPGGDDGWVILMKSNRPRPCHGARAALANTPTLDPSPQGGGRQKNQSRSRRLPPPCGEGMRVGGGGLRSLEAVLSPNSTPNPKIPLARNRTVRYACGRKLPKAFGGMRAGNEQCLCPSRSAKRPSRPASRQC